MEITKNKDLIVKAQSGDAHAFEALVTYYYETMFRMAYKFCGNKQNAEDITQEACMRLARGIASYRHDSAFTSWLYTLVLNVGKDWFRKNKRYNSSGDDELEMVKNEAPSADEKLYAKQVIAAVQRLPEGERGAVLLVLGEGMSHKEAGEILGCQEGTVSWRIFEARKKLTAMFEKGPDDALKMDDLKIDLGSLKIIKHKPKQERAPKNTKPPEKEPKDG